jgi:SatD family (SatD)
MAPRTYAVVTADIVESRKIEAFRKHRDQKLRPASKIHLGENLIVSNYAVTAWDEFQGILTRPSHVPRVIFDLRRLFQPMQLRIAVGIGRVSEPRKAPTNVFSGGEAFERAREAADQMKKDKGAKLRHRTRFASAEELFDQVVNTIYDLHDSLIQSTTPRQWDTINVLRATGAQELTAKKLKLYRSTISRNLRRGFYWQMEETQQTAKDLIEYYFEPGRSARA